MTDICPFNRNTISLPSEEPKSRKFNPEALPQATEIKYIVFIVQHIVNRRNIRVPHLEKIEACLLVLLSMINQIYLDFSDYSLSHCSSTPMRLGQGKYPLLDESIQSIPLDNSFVGAIKFRALHFWAFDFEEATMLEKISVYTKAS